MEGAVGRSSKTARRRAAQSRRVISGEVVKALPVDHRTNDLTGSGGQVATRPFPLYDAIAAATGMPQNLEQTSIPFPRDPRDNNAFGPNQALTPAPLDAPNPTTGQADPRLWEYPVSWNLPGNGNREVPWQVLRTASTAVDIIRRCIRYRQRTLRGLRGRWVISAEAIQEAYESNPDVGREDAEKTLRAQYADTIKGLTRWWRKPWRQNGHKFGTWVNMLLEEHLVLDAVAIYPRRALDGSVLDFQILDGATVKPLLDVQGATPCPPFPAFQQELYGFPRGEYGQAYTDEEIEQADGTKAVQRTVQPGLSTAQLFYHRENVRANSPYGLSSVEQALIAARLYLKRQGWMLAEYEDGSTPVTWVTPSEDESQKSGQAFTPTIRRAWEDSFNDEFGGSTRRRHRAKVLPPGWNALQTQSVDERYKPDYDLHLIKLLCGFFDVPITELGFSEAKGIGNSGLHEGMADVAGKVGDKPDTEVVAEIITDLARSFQGCPEEVEFQFVDPQSDDSLEKDQALDLQFKGAQMTLNGTRRARGEPVYNFPEADMPMLVGVGPTGVVFLEGLYQQQQADRQAALAVQQSQMESGLVQEDGTAAGDETAPPDDQGESTAPPSDTAKAAELTAYARWRRRNPAPHRPFSFKAATPDDIAVADHDPNLMAFEGWTWEPDLDKGAGWDPGVKRFRDTKGRFVKGSMAGNVLDALEDAGHAVTRHPDQPRKAKLSRLHEEAFDEAVRRTHAGKPFKRGENQLVDDLERHGLLEPMGTRGRDAERLGISDAGRAHAEARMPDAYAEQRGRLPGETAFEADQRARGFERVPTADRVGVPAAPVSLAGGTSADVQVITKPDGSKVVRKKITQDVDGWTPKEQADSEELGAQVAAALGVRAPKVKRLSDDTMEQEFLPGRSAVAVHGKDMPADVLASDEGIRMGLLDRITNNMDRNMGNWMVDEDGGIAAIDNGMMFTTRMFGQNPFAREHFDLDAPNALTPADVAALRPKLEALAPEFDRLGHADWHRNMMAEFDQVAGAASGKRHLYSSPELLHDQMIARQKHIDALRRVADLASEVDEFRHAEAGIDEAKRRVMAMSHRSPDDAELAVLAERVTAANSLEEMHRISAEAAEGMGLAPIGRAGDITPFDPALHQSIDGPASPGQHVHLIRPGYHWEGDPEGQKPRMHKAMVEEATPEEIQRAKSGRIEGEISLSTKDPAEIAELQQRVRDLEAGIAARNPGVPLKDAARAEAEADMGVPSTAERMRAAAVAKRAARLGHVPADSQADAEHRDLTHVAPVELPHDESSGNVEPMTTTDSVMRAQAALAPEQPADHVAALGAMTSREEATAYVAKIKGKDLDILARQYHIRQGTAADKRLAIIEATVGNRLNSQAIRGGLGEPGVHITGRSDRSLDEMQSTDPDLTPAQREILADLENRHAEAADEGTPLPRTAAERRAADAALRDEVADQLNGRRSAKRTAPGDTTGELVHGELERMQTREQAEEYLRRMDLSRAQLADVVRRQGKKPGSLNKEQLTELASRGARMRSYQNVVDETMAQRSDVTSREMQRLEGDARGQTISDAIARAEAMFGSDHSKWPATARRDLAKLEARAARESKAGQRAAGAGKPRGTGDERMSPRELRVQRALVQSEIDQAEEDGDPQGKLKRLYDELEQLDQMHADNEARRKP